MLTFPWIAHQMLFSIFHPYHNTIELCLSHRLAFYNALKVSPYFYSYDWCRIRQSLRRRTKMRKTFPYKQVAGLQFHRKNKRHLSFDWPTLSSYLNLLCQNRLWYLLLMALKWNSILSLNRSLGADIQGYFGGSAPKT